MDYIRWQELMQKFHISSNKETFNALIDCYSEKHRHYHDKSHIDSLLQHLDIVTDLADSPPEIELALWFHDAIYKPFSSNNERDSANWASGFLENNNVPNDVVARIYEMIMATLHNRKADTNDEELIIDIDLTILGAPESDYSQFEINVRKEYRLVPYFVYKKKRKKILSSFLAREKIFQTEYFLSGFEAQARVNLSSAIQSL